MKDQVFGVLQRTGLTRIMGPGTFWNALFTVMSQAGDIVFANLPILFAMGIAIGMAKKEKEVAALAAVISFLVMHAAIGAMIAVNGGTCSAESWWDLGPHGSTTGITGSSSHRCCPSSAGQDSSPS